MDHATQVKVYQAIIQTLHELGVPHAKFTIRDTTILVQDGFCVGRSLVRGHVRVLMLSGGERIEFRDKSGGILRMIFLPQSFVGQAEAA